VTVSVGLHPQHRDLTANALWAAEQADCEVGDNSHVIPEMQAHAAERLETVFFKGSKTQRQAIGRQTAGG
jgi:hypothetical protein